MARKIGSLTGRKVIETGEYYRRIAKRMGVSIQELNRIAIDDPSIDAEVDSIFAGLATSDTICVIDSRMAWWFMPNTISLHLTISPSVAAKRLYGRGNEGYKSIDDALKEGYWHRTEYDRSRFLSTYNVDIARLRNYDYVIDTSSISVEDVTKIIRDLIVQSRDDDDRGRPRNIVVSPHCLYPSQSIRDINSDSDPSCDFEGTNPIQIGYSYPYFFILDGHHRIRNGLRAGVTSFQPILIGEGEEYVVANISADQYFTDSVTLSRIYDWNIETGLNVPVIPTLLR